MSFVIGLFRKFSKVGVGKGQICLPRPSATATLSGRRQKDGKILEKLVNSVPECGLHLSNTLAAFTAARGELDKGRDLEGGAALAMLLAAVAVQHEGPDLKGRKKVGRIALALTVVKSVQYSCRTSQKT
jgi:hypothetical protein